MYKDFIQKLQALCFYAGEYDRVGHCKSTAFDLVTEYNAPFAGIAVGTRCIDWDCTGFKFIFCEGFIIVTYDDKRIGTAYTVNDALVYVSGMMSDICGTRIKLK